MIPFDLFVLLETARAATTLGANILLQSSLIVTVGLIAARLLRNHGAAVQSTVLRVTLVAVLACPFASWLLASAGVSGFGIELPKGEVLAQATEIESELPLTLVVSQTTSATEVVLSSDVVDMATPQEPTQMSLNSAEASYVEQIDQLSPDRIETSLDREATDLPGESTTPQPEQTSVRTAIAPSIMLAYAIALSVWSTIAALLCARIFLANAIVLRGRACAAAADGNAAAADGNTESLCASLASAIGVTVPEIRVSPRIKSPLIEGQLVTLEGTPAANARVRLETIQAAPNNNVQPWIDSLRDGTSMWKASVDHKHQNIVPNVVGMPESLTTDNEGRFRIKGIGRDRIARLFIAGPSVARTVFRVVARETDPLPTNLRSADMDGDKVYGAKFKHIVAPSQPIVGVLRDAETAQPLPLVTIESYQFAGSDVTGVRTNVLRTTTDAAGRFRLEGMPKGSGNRLLAVPNDKQPYFMREIPIPETEGLDPINVEVDMHRGIWITGKVVDKVTGEPVLASMKYLPFLSNEYAEKLPEFSTVGNGQVEGASGYQHRYITKPDGSFRLVGLPGRAIVGAETMSKHRRGAGADKIDGFDSDGRLPTYSIPLRASKTWPNVMAEINPAADAQPVSVVLEADPGLDVKINVTDEQGKPVIGYRVSGQIESSGWGEPIAEPSFTVTGLAPSETRMILIQDAERRLGKALRISNETSELAIKLEPCATVTGRLVDADGDAIARATLRALTQPNEDFNPYLPPISTDGQGRFEFRVPTGSEYRVQVRPRNGRTQTNVMSFAPEAGETYDMGELKVQIDD